MTAIDRNRNIAAGTATVGVWILLVILFSLFSLLPKKQVYKTVKIQLDAPSTPKIAEKQDAAPPKLETAQSAPVPQAPAPAAQESKPAKAAPKEQPKQPQKSVSKPAPKPAAKPQTKPAAKPVPKTTSKPAEQVLQKSVEERMAEQRTQTKVKKEVNWDDMFGDDSEENVSKSTSSSSASAVAQSNSFEGSAASVSKTDSKSSSSSSQKTSGKVQNASSATTAALGSVAAAVYSTTAGNGVTSSSTVTTASSTDGKIALVMNDGSSRILLEPKSPVLKLSDSAASTIDTTKEVKISFTVRPDGHVDINSITFTPSTIIGTVVKNEIADQISRWRFNADSSSATATFRHSIKTK